MSNQTAEPPVMTVALLGSILCPSCKRVMKGRTVGGWPKTDDIRHSCCTEGCEYCGIEYRVEMPSVMMTRIEE